MSITSLLTLGKLRTQRAVRSMYFVGVDNQQGTYFLDPHKTQEALHFDNIDEVNSDDFSSYHYTLEPKKTTIDQIDPSLLLGFFCRFVWLLVFSSLAIVICVLNSLETKLILKTFAPVRRS